MAHRHWENWADGFQGSEFAPALAWLAADPCPASEAWAPQLESRLASASHATWACPCPALCPCSGKCGLTGNGESRQQTPRPLGHRSGDALSPQALFFLKISLFDDLNLSPQPILS